MKHPPASTNWEIRFECRQVYTHRKAKSIEFMVVDAMMEADKIFDFREMLHDPELFVQLNDGVLGMVWKSVDVTSLLRQGTVRDCLGHRGYSTVTKHFVD